MAATQPRQNYHIDCEARINKQINMELYASYVYTSMAYYFDRDDVALPGFHKFFKKSSEEEREHAAKLMKYQNMRGGRVVLQPIQKPAQDEWGSGLDAMQASLELEKSVNQALLDLHKLATDHNDAQVSNVVPPGGPLRKRESKTRECMLRLYSWFISVSIITGGFSSLFFFKL